MLAREDLGSDWNGSHRAFRSPSILGALPALCFPSVDHRLTRNKRPHKNAFKTPIHVYSPTSPLDRWADIPHTRHAAFETFLPVLDVLSLHCPLTPSTRNLISDDELALMKRSAILINTARGSIVDEGALERVLREDRLGGAGIGPSL